MLVVPAPGCSPAALGSWLRTPRVAPDVEQWRPHFWSTHGPNDLHMGYLPGLRSD
jgi:hypothetical protein